MSGTQRRIDVTSRKCDRCSYRAEKGFEEPCGRMVTPRGKDHEDPRPCPGKYI